VPAGGPTFAQAPSPQAASAPAPQAQAAPAPRPLPDGAKYAVVNIQRIASESSEGKAATARVQALNQQKVNELNEKNKALQAAQQKLESGASVLSATAAAQLQKDIEKQQVEIQRFTEDAQKDLQNLQTQLQAEFERKLGPVIQQVATQKGLHLLFSATESGLIWGDPGLDITAEVIAKFDSATPAPAAPAAAAPAPKPAAPAPAAPAQPRQ
jgi:outer membrane protein